MKTKVIFTTIFLVFIFNFSFAQKDIEIIEEIKKNKKYRNDYELAQYYINNKMYNDAFNLLKKWETVYPDNSNLMYNIGICIYNSVDKMNAQQYFSKAAQNIAKDYENIYTSINAPLDVYVYLANIYHLKYEFDKAIDYYDDFLINAYNYPINYIDSVKWLKQKSYTAISYVKNPVTVKVANLGDSINTKYPEYSPVFNFVDSILYFTSRREGSTGGKKTEDGKYYEDIYYSQLYKNQDEYLWTNAKQLAGELNTTGHEATVSLSPNGKMLLVYRDDKGDGNIYYSEFIDGKWSALERFPTINSQYWETHARLSPDMKTIYFVSDRPGGYGGRDIWKSERGEHGWLAPENLGPAINSKYNEDAPFILSDGVTLYFASEGFENMGGFDIFSASLTEDGFWTTPENLGYPINTPGDDIFYYPSPDEKYAFYSSADVHGYGDQDIYLMTIEKPKIREIKLIGRTIDALSFLPVKSDISIKNIDNNEIVSELITNNDGHFEINLLPAYQYAIIASANGYNDNMKAITLIENDPRSVILIDIFLEKPVIAHKEESLIKEEQIKVGTSIVLRNIYFDFDKATLRPQSIEELDKLYDFLINNPTAIVEVSAHTDKIGSYEYNIKLSKKRAQAVVDYLIAKGIEPNRLIAKGYGYTKPIATNLTEAGRQLNRRVEFKIVGLE